MLNSKVNILLISLLIMIFSGCSDPDSEPDQVAISLSPETLTLSVGESADLIATVNVSTATDMRLLWSSSNTNVATVDNGRVTAVAEGRATISAYIGNMRADCIVVVSWIDPEFAKILQQKGYIKDAATVRPAEVENLKNIDVMGTSENRGALTSLKGIEYFSSLRELFCSFNNITTLDVSKNTMLESLFCNSNSLTTLDVSKNTWLTYLDCDRNNLTTLDVRNCTRLTYLYCQSNNLTAIDVRRNTQLVQLCCSSNNLTAIDVSKNMQLKYLHCDSNNLTGMNISKNISLTGFLCSDNPGSSGQFRVKAWFGDNSVPSAIVLYSNYKSSWMYMGSMVSIYYYK